MTDAQKLEALVEQAVKSGYISEPSFAWIPEDKEALIGWWMEPECYWRAVIFDPAFARALFGKRELAPMNQAFYRIIKEGYHWHLQQAVISDNPINYMYKVVFGEKE